MWPSMYNFKYKGFINHFIIGGNERKKQKQKQKQRKKNGSLGLVGFWDPSPSKYKLMMR